MRPEPTPTGTAVRNEVAVAVSTGEVRNSLNVTRLFAAVLSKFAPFTVTALPGTPMAGAKLVMIGAPPIAVTVKGSLAVAIPCGAARLIGPVVAPSGTVATSSVAVAATTVADTPLNR